ncbi:unnamed protein product [Bursaphelenchus xylophilus]|uniref:glutamate--tRNA ligase n=1 Tax=Bursaphelenchus xylophilus TaxID=6326 RepID=A0A1I7RV85_BURXY|nr:unnamed protein product [Bursaphelenchus xylophilus]CAG9086525.1 unnamed protein product [Bursaphelenchus xylophilus]
MSVSLKSTKSSPIYGSLLTASLNGWSFDGKIIDVNSDRNELFVDGCTYSNDVQIARFLASNSSNAKQLLGKEFVEQATIENILGIFEDFTRGLVNTDDLVRLVGDNVKATGHVVLGRETLADLIFWAILENQKELQKSFEKFFESMKTDKRFHSAHLAVGKYESAPPVGKPKDKVKDEGKFVDLPNAEMGKVVVRFPPEASGYLHIGHAKAALLNQHYQQIYNGKLVMRFDDTNPAKENAHFEEVIKEDLKLLGIKPDIWTHSSDWFDKMLEYCEKLLKEGKAYVDDTDMETMRKEREERVESKNWHNSVEKNLELWEEMKKGSERGQQCCVRIKIDMKSNNGALRDPTIYRCKNEPHVRTGDKYKVYPTYDFACPIIDALDGVTHSLRTTEYHDRDDQFRFIGNALGLRIPEIWSYARLNMTHTVMSKRKLTWLVDEKIVDGWDDPRLPTVRGIIRRGLTVEGLKQFILAQGGSRSVVTMEWDKIWAFNKKVIDPVAPRYTAMDTTKPLVKVNVKGQANLEKKPVNLHPKDAAIGQKDVWYGPTVFLEQADVDQIKSGDTVTFVNWGNLKILSVGKEIEAELDLENTNYKKTLKVTWLAEQSKEANIPVKTLVYSDVITKPIIGKDEDWKQFVDKNSVKTETFLAEPPVSKLAKGDIIQFQRKGYYIVDQAYDAKTKQGPTLILIPDGTKPSTTPDSSSQKAPAKADNGDASSLYSEIERQGNLVRDLKAKDPKGQPAKDAIARLLELKKQYKETTGQEYKPGQAPQSAATTSVVTGSSSAGNDLYEQIEKQGNLVRELKGKDAKSQETKDAIATLLDLKKKYKAATGQEYKPGQAPKPAESAPTQTSSASSGDVYGQIEAQGNLVRELKGKDAKSQATKDAIAKLLELKKQYKEATGQEYKPGQAPVPTPAAAPSAGNNAEDELYAQVEEQGKLVRELKGKDAKSDATKAAIAKLLELKKEYKQKTGKDYKPR